MTDTQGNAHANNTRACLKKTRMLGPRSGATGMIMMIMVMIMMIMGKVRTRTGSDWSSSAVFPTSAVGAASRAFNGTER